MIKAKYDKPKKLSCLQSCYLSFDYKPQIVEAIRMIPSRFYNIKDKVWEVPSDSIPLLQQELDEDWEFSGKKLTEKSMLDKTPKFHYDLPKALKTELYNFQREDFNILMNHDKYLLLNTAGTGKSIISITTALKRKEVSAVKRCLIIACVNSLKWNWVNEIHTHSNESVRVLGDSGKSTISSGDKLVHLNNLDDTFFIVTNIETLRNKEILDKLKKLIRKGEIEMVIVDEVHKNSTPSSQQAKGLLAICKYLKYIYLLSGTPLVNSPLNAYLPLKCVGGEQTNYSQFKSRYAVFGGFGGYQIIGYRNLKELQIKIDLVSTRKTKEDVLDLPPKVFIEEYLEMGDKQRRVYENVKRAILADIDPNMLALDPLTVMLRARQATAFTSIVSQTVDESIKLERLKEIIAETDGKIVIFSMWTTVTDLLEKHLDNYAIYTGKTANREAQIKKFKEDDNCKIIIGTTQAMGTGLTLTEADTMVFFDEPWNYANFEQASDRIYRIGTKKSVNIISLICRNTLDEFIHKMIKKKRMMGDSIIDRKFSVQDEKVLEFILSGEGNFYD